MIATSSSETRLSALSTVTAARIGPAHGVHTSDSTAPSPTPDQNPSPSLRRAPAAAASGW